MKKIFIFVLAGFLSLNALSFSPVSAQSYQGTADLLAAISSLQQQVTVLQNQLNQQRSGGGQNALGVASSTPNTLTVTKNGTGSGLVWSTDGGINCGNDCTESYASGTWVYLHAQANGDSVFISWGGDCSYSTSSNCTLVMNNNKNVNARFDLAGPNTLTVSKTGNGAGLVTSDPAGINCGNDCSESYASGTAVWLHAIPSQGSTFGAWTGCDVVSSTECRVWMNRNRTVNARFDFQNTPPSIDYVSGPTRLVVNTMGTWTARASDADGNLMRWDVFWGDNSSSSRAASGSSSMVTLDHSYASAGLKNIVFKIWDTNWAYDIASTTVNVITPNIKRLPFQGASFIESAQEQLATMMLQLQEMLKSLR